MQDTSATIHTFSIWRKFTFIFLFFVFTPIALGTSLVSLLAIEEPKNNTTENAPLSNHQANSGVQVYASLPSNFPSVSGEILGADARSEMLKQYLQANNSPLMEYSSLLVKTADKYNLDYRLLIAIAKKESGLCRIIPPGGHNCWGWGIHSEGTLGFDSYDESIETVAKGLKENYLDKGLVTPEEIMSRYTPHSPEGVWAKDVSRFIEEIY
ncbi:hypothetical protein IPM62_03205 [Candidatus Woesebacteria bacterium]|nr:MAG: hypothetical protein IPM62_03205 [Candidatus Woesebacteria bacterium]